jgi:hypothetical protein
VIYLILGSTGAVLILLAFVLVLFKFVEVESKLYVLLNIIGGILASIYAFSLMAVPLLVIEVTWTLFATYKLMIILFSNNYHRPKFDGDQKIDRN